LDLRQSYPLACGPQDIEVPAKAQSVRLVEAGHCTALASKQNELSAA